MIKIISNFSKTIEASFDKWATGYENTVIPMLRGRGYNYESLAIEIHDRLSKARNPNIAVELGVGSGVLGEQLYLLTKRKICGLDISSKMLLEAKRKNIYNVLFHGSAEELPFPNDSIDAIYSAFMLHSVLKQRMAIDEIIRVLKPGAPVVIVDLCPSESNIPFWNLLRGNAHSIKYEFGAFSKYRSPGEYRVLFERSGFKIAEIKQLGETRDYTHYLFHLLKPA